MILKPNRLQPGDKVTAISLSWGGPGKYPHRYIAGKRQLEETFHLEVVETAHALKDPEWLQRNPQARADDLMAAFTDPSIKGIISTIGGDDSVRILPYVDLNVIRDHPKIFLGYSDTTVTHFICNKAGLVSFYGPSIMAGFGENGGMHRYLVDAVRKTLFSAEPPGILMHCEEGWTVEHLGWENPANQARKRALNAPMPWKFLQGKGIRRGHLLGGCLEVVDWLRGTPVWPEPQQWENAILFLETSEEAPPPIAVTRFLRMLAAMGILEKISGILFGRPGGQIALDQFCDYDTAILQVVRDEQGLIDLPIVTRMDFGHTDPINTIPYGVQAEINCEKEIISIVESGVA